MSHIESAFEGNTSDTFALHAETLRGAIRYEQVQQNLTAFVLSNRLNVIDVGGGAGIDAVWLAKLGHTVTVLEPAVSQIEKAHQKLLHQPREIAERVQLWNGTVEDAIQAGKESSYDLVLSHCVAMYVDEPALYFNGIARLLRSRGRVSILEKGFTGALQKLQQVSNEHADEFMRTGRFINTQHKNAWAFPPDVLRVYLSKAGLTELSYSGVRTLHDDDTRFAVTVSDEEFQRILHEEQQAGHDSTLRDSAPLLHFTGRKIKA